MGPVGILAAVRSGLALEESGAPVAAPKFPEKKTRRSAIAAPAPKDKLPRSAPFSSRNRVSITTCLAAKIGPDQTIFQLETDSMKLFELFWN